MLIWKKIKKIKEERDHTTPFMVSHHSPLPIFIISPHVSLAQLEGKNEKTKNAPSPAPSQFSTKYRGEKNFVLFRRGPHKEQLLLAFSFQPNNKNQSPSTRFPSPLFFSTPNHSNQTQPQKVPILTMRNFKQPDHIIWCVFWFGWLRNIFF